MGFHLQSSSQSGQEQEQAGGVEMCYQTRDYSPSHLSKFVNLGVDHWTGPPRPSTPFVKAAHWSGARDKFL